MNFRIKNLITTENISKIMGVAVTLSLLTYPMKIIYEDTITPFKSNKLVDKLTKSNITDEETINLAKKADAIKSFDNASSSLCSSFNGVSMEKLIKLSENIDKDSIEKLSDEEFFTRIDDFIDNVYYVNKDDNYKMLSKDEKNKIKDKLVDEFIIINEACLNINDKCKGELTKKILSYRIGQIISENDSVEVNEITSIKNKDKVFFKLDLSVDGKEKTLITGSYITQYIDYINNAKLYNTTDKLSELLDSKYRIDSNVKLLGIAPLNISDYKENIFSFLYTYALSLGAFGAGYLTKKGIQKIKIKEDCIRL